MWALGHASRDLRLTPEPSEESQAIALTASSGLPGDGRPGHWLHPVWQDPGVPAASALSGAHCLSFTPHVQQP